MGGHAPGPCLGGAPEGLLWTLLWAVLAPSDRQGRGGPFLTLWLAVSVAPTATTCTVWVVQGPDGEKPGRVLGDLREGAEPQSRERRGAPEAPGVQRPILRAVVPLPPVFLPEAFPRQTPPRAAQKHFFLKPG